MEKEVKAGFYGDEKIVIVEVIVRQAADGSVKSRHRLTRESAVVADQMSSGGHEEIAYAMLIEALHREMILESILREEDPETCVAQRYFLSSPQEQQDIRQRMCSDIKDLLVKLINEMGDSMADEALRWVKEQLDVNSHRLEGGLVD